MYDNLNDYELVSQAQELNEDAINILNEKYRPLIQKKCRKYIKYLKDSILDENEPIESGDEEKEEED